VSLIKAALGICETGPLDDSFWAVEDGKVRVKLDQMPAPLAKGGSTYLRGKGLSMPVFLMRSEDDQYLAFENRCSHFGHRKLDPVPGENKIRCCSVFHSTYDLDGNKLTGPAPNPLKRYTVEQSNGELVITL